LELGFNMRLWGKFKRRRIFGEVKRFGTLHPSKNQ
jgi:hypothetical protein